MEKISFNKNRFEKDVGYVKPPGKVISQELDEKIKSINLEDFQTGAFKEIFPPICNIVFDLKDKIKKGEYSLVIGDDASGHIPALIIYKLIKEIYKKENKDIKILFLAGSRGIDNSLLAKKKEKISNLLNLKIDSSKKVLVVTDIVYTGETLLPLKNILDNLGTDFDLASVSVLREQALQELNGKFDNKIIYGTHGELQTILGNSSLSGVEKDPGNIFAKRKKMDEEELAYFRAGREDVELAVKKLLDFYYSL